MPTDIYSHVYAKVTSCSSPFLDIYKDFTARGKAVQTLEFTRNTWIRFFDPMLY